MSKFESSQSIGCVSCGVLYTAAEARQRLGLGDWAWRQLRRRGLRSVKVSGRSYVLGDDLIAFFRDCTKQSTAVDAGSDVDASDSY